MISSEYLKSLLYYEPETGEFLWVEKKQGRPNDRSAGTKNTHGYTRINIDGTQYPAHHLAWLYMTGEWPTEYVAHKDDNQGNNTWTNLEEMSIKEHQQKRAMAMRDRWNEKVVDPLQPKPRSKASFSNTEVHEAVEEFIKNKTLINGVYV